MFMTNAARGPSSVKPGKIQPVGSEDQTQLPVMFQLKMA